MREWRNWQTRTFEGRVVLPYGFKSRFSHHSATGFQWLFYSRQADMAELADALDSGSSECKFMQVQVLLSAPRRSKLCLLRFFLAKRHVRIGYSVINALIRKRNSLLSSPIGLTKVGSFCYFANFLAAAPLL